MASSAIVIKVKFGETLRRFSASIDDKKLALDVVALRTKIRALFNFNPDVDFTLTYVDEDGDAVTLADDDDLHDVVRQSLNPLRITVTLKNETKPVRSSFTSPPLRSPQPQTPSGQSSNVLLDFLKALPEPLLGKITELPLRQISMSSPAVVSELVEKLTASYLNQISNSTPAPGPSTEPESSNSKNKEKVSEMISEKMSEGVKMKEAQQPPVPMDLNVPYFNYESFPSLAKGFNGQSSEKNKDTAENVEQKKDSSGWAQGMLNSTSQCPFSGIQLPSPNDSYHHPSRGHGHHHWKKYGHGNGIGNLVFHIGVRCDGCGVHPITGPRYKSKVKEDYDLCSDCFTGMGNASDYIKMDRPTNVVRHHHHHSMGFKGFHDNSKIVMPPGSRLPGGLIVPAGLRISVGKLTRSKLDSRFILDVNVLDGTTMAPFTAFTKIWRMRNNGTVTWPRGSQLQWIGGDRLSNSVSVDIEIPAEGYEVEKELDIAVDFNAPELPGRYISYWRMASPTGQKFGQRVWVLIQVDTTMKDLGGEINLNLPPVNIPTPPINNLIKVTDSESTSTSQDTTFPTNDTLIINNNNDTLVDPPVFRSAEVETALGISPTTEVLQPITYPAVDFPEIGGAAPSPVDPSGSGMPEGGEQQEKNLLEELVSMGFKQLDLNKEILRMNNYDLEKSVDDLCGVSEWDPMLEELQEMGFVDEEANRRLLKKNNGSIKRVVMDLINGERA